MQGGKTPACSCVDCVASCPKPPIPDPTPQPFKIWGYDGYAVVMFFIFLLGSLIFIMGAGCCSSSEGKIYGLCHQTPRNVGNFRIILN